MPAKMERLEARVSKDLKMLLERAAGIQGRSLTDFVVEAAREAAARTVEHAQLIKLTAKDQHIFIQALLEPYQAPQRLRAAASRYKKLTSANR